MLVVYGCYGYVVYLKMANVPDHEILRNERKVNFADGKASSRVARGCRGAPYQEYTSQERKKTGVTTQVYVDVLQEVVEFVAIEAEYIQSSCMCSGLEGSSKRCLY